MNRALGSIIALAATGALLSSCGHRKRSVATVTPPPAAQPVPAAPANTVPGALPINRGLGPGEMLWHVRAALNVAALACTAPAYAAMTPQYNALLRRHDAMLTQAYKEEEGRYRQQYGAKWQTEFDRHQTALYNSFADPRATQALCGRALSLSGQINALDPAQLPAFAGQALAELETPVASVRAVALSAVAAAQP